MAGLYPVRRALEKKRPRRFILRRKVDVNGTSGTGIVLWGVQWPDGTVACRWNSEVATHIIFANVADVERIHGHDGATVLVWQDRKPHRKQEGSK
jgi:hypothetical protein